MPTTLQAMPSQRSGPDGLPLGSVEPRLWTPPLRELTPETSYGFDVVEFAHLVLREPLDESQEWAVIHIGELLPDGRPRFRRVLILMARQNGKTHLLKVLALYWLHVECWPLILGTSTNLDYAKEAWEKAVDSCLDTPALAAQIGTNGIRRANGEQTLTTVDKCRYKIAAANRRGGRSLTVHRLVVDEVREHKTWEAYNASVPATNAVPRAQILFASNSGDDTSVVLNSLRDSALLGVRGADGADPRLGIFEWSAPEGRDVDDPEALAMANPSVGRRMDWDTLLGPARVARQKGGDEEASFRTEYLCERVRRLEPAIDLQRWAELGPTAEAPSAPLDGELRRRTAMAWDLSPDGLSATLYAAAVDGDVVRLDAVKAWSGATASKRLRAELPGLIARTKPAVLGWFPTGPSAALAARLAERKGTRRAWPPHGVRLEPIKAEVPQVCMGFAELVRTGGLRHSGDPRLTAQLEQAQRGHRGDVWVFTRPRDEWIDATYAAAGAVHLAQTMSQPRLVDELVVVGDDE